MSIKTTNTTNTTIQHEVKLSVKVSKLGSAIPSINFPPIVTCRANAPCAKCVAEGGRCYALKGNWNYQCTKNRLNNNLLAYQENPKAFFDSVIVQTRLFNFVRWFSSGDIIDMEFLKGMCRVARTNKNTKYLCFTKKFELVNEFLDNGGRIPSNLKIVFSTWGDFIPENPHNLPMTWVMFKKGSVHYEHNKFIPETAIPCTGKCYLCQACWGLKKGQNIVFNKH